ncbi:hypothetical protein CB0940_08399 [Cercospora beticola]|uniref:Heterokaryon incompatibility Het-C n=1 Tax=Cercospora beticola TaxID=122368 RepID=A0A2G5HQY3_CERBT|nr:hypothetical protein CB0940_08399 [Cercospora beticola]PIA94642.1 hypothetical protein CB0940_08399 [Cercospora beticola]WPB04975.1 hypothetical protein RHO25_009623 [Cercospora beticola]CAK1364750.1 unnamed protein product [Cercospora beticola]
MPRSPVAAVALICFCLLTCAHAFGAGEVPEDNEWLGYVWRHGDIGNLLPLLPVSFVSNYAFTKLQAKQVYFGNWLRDFSQLLDTTCLDKVHESILRAVVAILAFMEFGLATDGFDVTKERLGVYRHEEHIDNPKGYADLPDKDATKIDGRLRGPVREVELEVDPKTGMKNYIANSGKDWTTSADYIRKKLWACIEYKRNENEADALISLGAAMHTIEDFAAHSNFIELCLREFDGCQDIFAFVGDKSWIEAPGSHSKVPPLTTGTFGAVDILHSFLGEADDRAAIINRGETRTTSFGDLSNMQSKLFSSSNFKSAFQAIASVAEKISSLTPGNSDIAGQLQSINSAVTDAQNNSNQTKSSDEKSDEPFPNLWNAIHPIFKLHDDIQLWTMKHDDGPTFPGLSKAIEDIKTQADNLAYKLLAAFIEPALNEVRAAAEMAKQQTVEMSKASEIWEPGSMDSNPTHSELAKDHFSNLLNQPAGIIATICLNWSTQQIVKCWDDPSLDVEETIEDILSIMHHPAFVQEPSDIQRYMQDSVREWWDAHSEDQHIYLLKKLSKESAQDRWNHHDHTMTARDMAGRGTKGFASFPGAWPETTPRPVDDTLRQQFVKKVQEVADGLRNASEKVVDAAHTVGDKVGVTKALGLGKSEELDDAVTRLAKEHDISEGEVRKKLDLGGPHL